VFRSWLNLNVEVYATMGINDCPQADWTALDSASLAKKYSALAFQLNGPRHWVVDNILNGGETAGGRIVKFGNIEMKMVGELSLNFIEAVSQANKVYYDLVVKRPTVWVYKANRTVYELRSPTAVYIMQSYSQAVDKTLTAETLAGLGSKLALPQGWSFSSRVLTSDLQLDAHGTAIVINDNFGCSYQKL
jgi:hypothetical protein